MKNFTPLLLITFIQLIFGCATKSTESAKDDLSAWNGTYKYPGGETLTLEAKNGSISGTLSDGQSADVELSDDGKLMIEGATAYLSNDTIYYTLQAAGSSEEVFLVRENPTTDSKYTSNENPTQLLKFSDIEINLLDASLNKCKKILGEPDKSGYLYSGNENKIALVYLNKVQDSDGKTKHLIVFLRSVYNVQKPRVEDVKAVSDGEKASYGIHYVRINGNKIQSNSRDF